MKISLRTSILTNLIVLTLVIALSIVAMQYNSSTRLAEQAIDKTFKLTTDKTVNFILSSESSTKKTLAILAQNDDITDGSINVHKMLDDFSSILVKSKNLRSFYVGFSNDDFYEVINIFNHRDIVKKFNAPIESRWAVLRVVQEQNISEIEFLDSNFKLLHHVDKPLNFKPKDRPWYKKAVTSTEVVTTDIYRFPSHKSGISFAKETTNKKAVIALDFDLGSLEDFMEKQNFDEDGHIFLYSSNGELIATSNKTTPSYSWNRLFKFFSNMQNNKTHKYMHNGVLYYVYHTLSNKESLHIGIVIPQHKLMKPYIDEIKNTLYLALSLLLFSFPLAFISASMITRPIQKLMLENKKITNREFEKVKEVKTSIKELHELSHSLIWMSKSIQEYQKSQEELLDSIIKLIAKAIDSQSTYTGGHCNRVPNIATMLTKKACESKHGIFKDFEFKSEDEWREFHIGAWLHDCGKVTTPAYVVDKSTKLESINNRIHEIRTRFEVLYRDAQITYLEEQLRGEDKKESLTKLNATQAKLIEEFEFIASSNLGGEFMDEKNQERVKSIASREWIRNFDDRAGLADVELLRYADSPQKETPAVEKLLCDKKEHIIKRDNFDHQAYIDSGFKEEVPEYLYNYGEVYNLCIKRGTLCAEERFKINEHVIMTIKMLEQIPFPSNMSKIPEYAGTHHETMIGTGYPRKLSREDLSIPARIMAIADIYEALTASDRPYKKAKTVSQALKIMSFMVKDEHIDGEIFKLFLESGAYMEYAKSELKPEQLDEVNIQDYT